MLNCNADAIDVVLSFESFKAGEFQLLGRVSHLLLRALWQGAVVILDPGFQLLEEQGLLAEGAGVNTLEALTLVAGLQLQSNIDPDLGLF